MPCNLKPLLSAFIDGELPEKDRLEVAAHLPSCSGCRSECDDLKSMSSLLRGLPARPLPPGLISRVKARAKPAAELPWFVFSPGRAAAFALPSLALGWALFRPASAPSPLLRNDPPPAQAVAAADPPPAAPVPKSGVSNEALHAALEKEKARMGIAKILPAGPSAAEREWRRRQGDALQLAGLDRAAAIGGERPAMLAADAAGASAGVPLESAALATLDVSGPGVAIKSQGELVALWQRLSLPLPAPSPDFSTQMLVVVLAGRGKESLALDEVAAEEGALRVRYRASSDPGAVLYPARVVPLSNLPVVFERR